MASPVALFGRLYQGFCGLRGHDWAWLSRKGRKRGGASDLICLRCGKGFDE